MTGGRRAVRVSVVGAIVLVAYVAVLLMATVPGAVAAHGGGLVGALTTRDTPTGPPPASSSGVDWVPWAIVASAVAATAGIWLAFFRIRRRPKKAPRAPIDRLPDDWPQL